LEYKKRKKSLPNQIAVSPSKVSQGTAQYAALLVKTVQELIFTVLPVFAMFVLSSVTMSIENVYLFDH
jgi:hypothetical protein